MSGDEEPQYVWPAWSATAAAFSVVALSLAAVYRKRQQSLAEQTEERERKDRAEKESRDREEQRKREEEEIEKRHQAARYEQERREKDDKERAEREKKEQQAKENEEREKKEKREQEAKEKEQQEQLRKEREISEVAIRAAKEQETETTATKIVGEPSVPPEQPRTEDEEQEGTIIKDIYSIEEMNEPGLVRGRKTTSIREGRRQKQIYQMEDVCLIEYPFDQDPNKALLAVFDGHAGRFAAEAARNIVSKVFFFFFGS